MDYCVSVSKDSSERLTEKHTSLDFLSAAPLMCQLMSCHSPRTGPGNCFISVKWDVRAAFWHLHLQTSSKVLITEGNQLSLALGLAVNSNP